MKLYYSDTLSPRKACAVAKYLNSPVEYIYVDLGKGEHKTPAFLKLNPNGKVPALEDGDVKLWEADAIICHLARKAGSDLWPRSEQDQTDVMRWLSWNAQHYTRHGGTLYFEHLIRPRFNLGPTDDAEVADAQKWFRQFSAVLNDHLRGRDYVVGDTLSVADFAVAIALPYAEKAKIPVGEFPEIVRWHARMNELPAWRDPFPAQHSKAA
jgi:glutathione S-transferase